MGPVRRATRDAHLNISGLILVCGVHAHRLPGESLASRRAYVLFDLGGTLVDLSVLLDATAEVVRDAFPRASDEAIRIAHRCAESMAKELPLAQGSRFVTERRIAARALRDALAGSGVRIDARRAARLVARARAAFLDRVRLFDDVDRPWLDSLREVVAGLGLVSDADDVDLQAILTKIGLSSQFDVVTSSESVRSYKPDRRIYEAAIAALRADPRRTLFVSDSATDLQGASALGMRPVHIARTSSADGAAPPAGTRVLTKLRDLEVLLHADASVSGDGTT